MTKKELCIILSKLKLFDDADMRLEQHPTDSEVAGSVLWDAYMRGDIEGKTIIDLGAGTGILGLGALLLGAKKVFFVDADEKAIKLAKDNQKWLEEQTERKLEATYTTGDINYFEEKADMVIMNPPFGTKNAGIDIQFLTKAMSLAPTIYSFHKASTKEYVDKTIKKTRYYITHYKEYKFPLKQTMKHHKKKIERIRVGLWRMEKR